MDRPGFLCQIINKLKDGFSLPLYKTALNFRHDCLGLRDRLIRANIRYFIFYVFTLTTKVDNTKC